MSSVPLRGVILYRGPSQLDGKPIVAIATLKTYNEKTGDMVQTWILREDVAPTVAINTGDDVSVCGNCPLRGRLENGRNVGRACYVQVRNAPRAMWHAYRAGRYPHYSAKAHLELFSRSQATLGILWGSSRGTLSRLETIGATLRPANRIHSPMANRAFLALP